MEFVKSHKYTLGISVAIIIVCGVAMYQYWTKQQTSKRVENLEQQLELLTSVTHAIDRDMSNVLAKDKQTRSKCIDLEKKCNTLANMMKTSDSIMTPRHTYTIPTIPEETPLGDDDVISESIPDNVDGSTTDDDLKDMID